eukprot:CAMPEP_0197577228 /NCGR_PEP_ID=MMETSP1326-20131121/1933_1 /TAXON_ID=1155430 /ORGANISM="Genus nov. species nov., Strain RCC2288" /LENGTH=312 /DNA_ID=CAMNT_0043140263 /DNA_START=274 /DNA_END=1208 /DNA_ORIENTATION=+
MDAHEEPPPAPGMEIQRRAEEEEPRRPPKPRSGGIVSMLSKWQPHKTPKITASVGLYLFGLFVAFVARPPVTITDEMQTRYFEKMEDANSVNVEGRMAAEQALLQAQGDVRDAQVWFWYFAPESRARVAAARGVERLKQGDADVFRRERDNMLREAKGELGLWSSLGIDEAKALFKKSYERGKLFATRSSYYDMFWLIIAGRSDQNMAELLIRWGFTVLSNFTVGMISAIVSFMFALPALISTFATSTASAVAFYFVASVSAASVVLSFLLLLYGTAGGAVYGMAQAAPAMARIEQQRRAQERVRLIEQHRR